MWQLENGLHLQEKHKGRKQKEPGTPYNYNLPLNMTFELVHKTDFVQLESNNIQWAVEEINYWELFVPGACGFRELLERSLAAQ